MENLHLIPVDDLKPHVYSVNCACRPYRHPQDEDLVVHIAYDGREFAEQEERELIDGYYPEFTYYAPGAVTEQ